MAPNGRRDCHALDDHPEGAHLRADRRHGRGADDVVAGAAWRRAQLGLPLLLVARRDLTLLGAMHAGYYEEAQAWRQWLLRAVAGSPGQLQIMYGIAGERRLSEWTAPWLPGYENSAPVRIGNAAHSQLQLDVFGEIMDVHHQARRSGLSTNESGWATQVAFLEHLEKIWREPDEGIWEVRGNPQHFTHSKVMAWVAFDRGIKSAETFGLEGADRRLAPGAAGDLRGGVCERL